MYVQTYLQGVSNIATFNGLRIFTLYNVHGSNNRKIRNNYCYISGIKSLQKVIFLGIFKNIS